MAKAIDLETLFKKHSLDEIESLRDNLAQDIEKKTELLKSAVKEKYRDIVETSDAIHSMKDNIEHVSLSLRSLDENITSFYTKIRNPKNATTETTKTSAQQKLESDGDKDGSIDSNTESVNQLLQNYADIWDHFDSGRLNASVKLLNESLDLMKTIDRSFLPRQSLSTIEGVELSLQRSEEMIRNYLWFRIENAEPDQIGLIAASAHQELYELSLKSSMQFIAEPLKQSLSDTSYQGQIRRFQPHSYIDKQTNQLNPEIDDLNAASGNFIQIPKLISPELNTFLCEVCRIVKTIAGFNLNRNTIVETLEKTLNHAIEIYSQIEPLIASLRPEMRRKRALQLYFDLLYLKLLLNESKSIELIERVDSRLIQLTGQFESMLDPVELYTISPAVHSNVMQLSQSTTRVYGLLTPHLY